MVNMLARNHSFAHPLDMDRHVSANLVQYLLPFKLRFGLHQFLKEISGSVAVKYSSEFTTKLLTLSAI